MILFTSNDSISCILQTLRFKINRWLYLVFLNKFSISFPNSQVNGGNANKSGTVVFTL